jgi:hypothetical protein
MSNPLAEFPPEQFRIDAHCNACGHTAVLGHDRLNPRMTIDHLRARLRCSKCQSNDVGVTIAYVVPGGFRYG